MIGRHVVLKRANRHTDTQHAFLTTCSEKEIDEIENRYCVDIVHTCTLQYILLNRGGMLRHYYVHVRVYYIVRLLYACNMFVFM